MIEILFSEGAAGSILDVIRSGNDVLCSTEDFIRMVKIGKTEPKEVEGKPSQELENGIQVEEELRNIACFPLNLSLGDVSEPFSDGRAAFLQSMVRMTGEEFSGVGRELLETARMGLKTVLDAADAREPVRIWYSRNPDEFCGFCHLLSLLPKGADIRVVELPEYEVLGRELRTYSGWADMEPADFGRSRARERSLTDHERRYFAGLWRELQAENGPLRAVVTGRLCTVEADFYDGFLLRELENQPREFHEARFIGTVLGKYLPGLSDWLIAQRLEAFISRGMLTPATEPEEHHPIYHRILRKEGF